MFRSKGKQQKDSQKNNKLQRVDQYYKKTKDKHFQIFLNSGVNEFDSIQENTYVRNVNIDSLQELQQNLTRGFSSIYQIDYKSFEWKDKLQGILKAGRQIIKVIEKIKQGMKQIQENKTKIQTLQSQNIMIRNEYEQLKDKYSQLLLIKSHRQLQQKQVEQMKIKLQQYQKQIKRNIQKQEQLTKIKQSNQQLRKQNQSLKQIINNLKQQLNHKNYWLKNIKDSSYNQQIIKKMILTQKLTIKDSSNSQLQSEGSKTSQLQSEFLNMQKNQQKQQSQSISLFEMQILLNKKLSSCIVSYLTPRSLVSLYSLSRTSRFYLLHNPKVIIQSYKSIIGYKNWQINFYHRHIQYFQKQCKKVPQQILQNTFYQYNILKQNIGGDFYSILNLCSNIFQGKFNEQTIQITNKTIKQYVQSKQLIHYIKLNESQSSAHQSEHFIMNGLLKMNNNTQQIRQEKYLKVNPELVSQFYQQRKVKKQYIYQQIQSMVHKITFTQTLYSVDNQTLKSFYNIIIKLFTVLFVLSKNLFNQSKNLQYLNQFLLNQLTQINKFKIEKEYDLQDIKAELQASNKMSIFLSDKCNKTQQRMLRQNKQLLQIQKHYSKLAQNIKLQHSKYNKLQKQINQKNILIQTLKQKHNQLKTIYNHMKQKYNRLNNQLSILKETILRTY